MVNPLLDDAARFDISQVEMLTAEARTLASVHSYTRALAWQQIHRRGCSSLSTSVDAARQERLVRRHQGRNRDPTPMTAPSPWPDQARAIGPPVAVRPGVQVCPTAPWPGARPCMRSPASGAHPCGPGSAETARRPGGGGRPGAVRGRAGPAHVRPGLLGVVDLVRADGERVARLDLADWVPEAAELTDSAECAATVGAEAIARACRPGGAPRAGRAARRRPPGSGPALLPLQAVPRPYTVLRSVAIVIAVVALLRATRWDVPDLLWRFASLGLLVSTLAGLGLWLDALWRDRPWTATTRCCGRIRRCR